MPIYTSLIKQACMLAGCLHLLPQIHKSRFLCLGGTVWCVRTYLASLCHCFLSVCRQLNHCGLQKVGTKRGPDLGTLYVNIAATPGPSPRPQSEPLGAPDLSYPAMGNDMKMVTIFDSERPQNPHPNNVQQVPNENTSPEYCIR